MMAYVSVLATRAGESFFGRCWSKAGDIVDRVIPIALVTVILAGCAAIAFGFVQ
jgi:hypothetical protein